MSNIKKKRLGRGLEALLSATSPAATEVSTKPTGSLEDNLKPPGPDGAAGSYSHNSASTLASTSQSLERPEAKTEAPDHTAPPTTNPPTTNPPTTNPPTTNPPTTNPATTNPATTDPATPTLRTPAPAQSMADLLAAKAMAPGSASIGSIPRPAAHGSAANLSPAGLTHSDAVASHNDNLQRQHAGGLHSPPSTMSTLDSATRFTGVTNSIVAIDRTKSVSKPVTGDKVLQVDDSGIPLDEEGEGISDIQRLDVFDIEDNPFQPRRVFSESEIASLSESLKEHDMLQPVLVRRVGQRFQLISGERRLRAAIQAGWKTIPARVRIADDRLVAELAIVENLQRKDLNALEKALSFRRYLNEHHSTQEVLAARLKIDRSTIANLMRLLELPQLIQDNVSSGSVTAGHARALLPLGEAREQILFCNRIIKEGWNVRETESRVSQFIAEQDGVAVKPKRKSTNPQIESLENRARMSLGTKVEIKLASKGAGKMIVHFKNEKEFQRIFEQMCQEQGLLSKVA